MALISNRIGDVCILRVPIWLPLARTSVRILVGDCAIRKGYFFFTIGVFDCLDPANIDPLHCPVREYALLIAVGVNALERAVGKTTPLLSPPYLISLVPSGWCFSSCPETNL